MKKERQKKCIVVLGMHCSGTSALTRGLLTLGVSLGEHLIPNEKTNDYNDEIHWEDIEINALNNEILSQVNNTWHKLTAVSHAEIKILQSKGYQDRAAEFLLSKIGDNVIWGFKDPRVTKLLPFWQHVFLQCDLNVSYVFSARHPLSVAQSLMQRDNFDYEMSHYLTLGYMVNALHYTTDENLTVVDYDNLMANPGKELKRIAKNNQLKIKQEELAVYTSEFLDEESRHSQYDLEQLSSADSVPPLLVKVYQELVLIATDKVNHQAPAFSRKTKNWHTELNRLAPSFLLVDKLFIQKLSNETLLEKSNGLSKAVSERDKHLSDIQQQRATQDSHIKELNEALSERDDQLSGIKNERAAQDSHIKELNKVVSERDKHLSDIQQQRATQDGHIEGLNKIVSERDKHLSDIQQQRATQDSHIEELNKIVSERDKHLSDIQQQRATQDSHIEELNKIVSARDKHLSDIQQQRATQDSHIGELNKIVSARDKHLGEIQQQRARQDSHIEELNEVVSERDKRLSDIQQQRATQDSHIEELSKIVSERDKRLSDIQQQHAAQDSYIEELSKVVSERDEQLSGIKKQCAAQDSHIEELNEALSERDKQLSEIQQQGSAQDTYIEELTEALSQREREGSALSQALSDHERRMIEINECILEQEAMYRKNKVELYINQHAAELFLHQLTVLPDESFSSQLVTGWLNRHSLKQDKARLDESELFDQNYYTQKYTDVEISATDPAQHYLLHGWRLLYNPSEKFNTYHYLIRNPDVAIKKMNPLMHYLQYGESEGRVISIVPTDNELEAQSDECKSIKLIREINLSSMISEHTDSRPAATAADELETVNHELETVRNSKYFDETYYVDNNPELHDLGIDLVRHFCEHGWREGRNPSHYFDTNYYLKTNTDIKNADINPLYHYIKHGSSECRVPLYSENSVCDDEIETIRNSGYFNETHYLNDSPELHNSGIDLARHFCEHGWREGRNPSYFFDTDYYLKTNTDIKNAGINPLYHYIKSGKSEFRQPLYSEKSVYEDECYFGKIETDIKLLAFYLPQFHSIPENDECWGNGFTEWTNTRQAKPVIESHNQPRQPHDDIGFYDLGDWEVLQRQTEMAARHGIYGFCFYHYWFAGKRLLERPIDMLLQHREIDFPFCLCWANENWTRRWDGQENDVLIEQQHSPDDDIAFINDLTKYIRDERYIRIENKPLILLYKDEMLADAKETLARWRNSFRENGTGEVYFVCAYGSFADTATLLEYGFDAAYEFPPSMHVPEQLYYRPIDPDGFNGNLCHYEQFIHDVLERREELKKTKEFDLFYSIMLEWDNTARRGKEATIFTHYSVAVYRHWLEQTIDISRQELDKDKRFVFINAWNAWAEGTYLEPDRKNGYLSLNETSKALCNIEVGRALPKVSVIVPNYNHEQYLQKRLDSIYQQTYKNIEVILLDDRSSDNSREILNKYAEEYADITRKEYNDINSGGVFKQWSKGMSLAKGELIWIAESDDYCDSDFLDTLVRQFDDEAVLLAYSKYVFVDETETPVKTGGFADYVGEIDPVKWNAPYVETAHHEVNSALGIINTIPNSSGVVFRRPPDMQLLNNKDWLSMSIAGDWRFYLHIILGGKIAYDNTTCSYFRRHENSTVSLHYSKEAFYRELGVCSQTVAALYDVPLSVLERSRDYYLKLYQHIVAGDDDDFYQSYDFESVVNSRQSRLPNVMVSLSSFYPGGAEILPIHLANELKRRGVPVLLHSNGIYPKADQIRKMVRNDIPVVETNDVDLIKKIIHDFNITILNSHHWDIQRYPLSNKDIFSDLPCHVATLHGMLDDADNFGVSSEDLQIVDDNIDIWIYTADKNLARFRESDFLTKDSARFIEIPNGAEAVKLKALSRHDMGIPDNAFVLCCVSRAVEEKGWVEAVEAVKTARELSGHDIRLVLVGDGPVFDEYCRTGLPDFVSMPGLDNRSTAYYAMSDMGIMLSRFKSESFPLTVIDCLLAGRPFIGSNLGEINNMLSTEQGYAGAVFELDDWTIPLQTVVEIIVDFSTNQGKYAQARQLVPLAAQRYTIESVTQQYIDLFVAQSHRACLKKYV